ncbi:hypothetical protein [Ferrimicrobium sp.]|uniref:hypothetical protein n=1 Tax=Ferrimicrobium sp. TaxID=2926050 RepID=UPI002622A954|nr:hypothetical protein [Ferrimicrobium sp.]
MWARPLGTRRADKGGTGVREGGVHALVILSDHQVALGSLVLDSVLGWVGLSVWTWRARSLVLGRVVLSGVGRGLSVLSIARISLREATDR